MNVPATTTQATGLLFPTTIEAAAGQPGELRAGGSDLQERRHLRISRGAVVDLRDLAGLDAIEARAPGYHVGALTRITALAEHADIAAHYPGLAQAAGGLATPEIRNRATIGGNLLQQVRCWYYRQPGANCLRAGGASCHARGGDHLYHVCFDRGPCVAPHPSTLATALLAYEARVIVAGGAEHTIEALYGDGSDPRPSKLPAGALITGVSLPAPLAGEKAAYLRATARARAEWPLVEVVVRLGLEGETIRTARVTLGGVAPVPLRAAEVEAALVGKPATGATLVAAAKGAAAGAKPLPMTQYKVELLPGTVLEALEQAMGVKT
jgi:xanthine dehydrogenase YagS FAD-binding subunit